MPLQFLEAHSPLSAILIEKSKYDGIWISSLTHSAIRGLPDNELVSLKERVELVEEIKKITTKPILVDFDTGGQIEHLPYYIKWFEKVGTWGVIIEDKRFPKQNSLLAEGKHQLEEVDIFCQKIKIAKENTKEMKVFARLESLIAQKSIYDALIRTEAYIQAGTDGILIHSKEKITANEVMGFAKEYKEKWKLPLIAIPSTYELPKEHQFDIIIYANMMLRASIKAMENVVNAKNPKDIEMVSVEDIFRLVGH